MAEIDAAIAERAAEQLGLITTKQASSLGATWAILARRRDQGALVASTSRVLRLAAVPVTWEQRLLAAQLHAGPGAVVSHRAAAALWRFDGATQGVVELTLPRGRNPSGTPGLVHTTRHLPPVDVTRKGPFTLTTPARTLLDLAAVLPYEKLEIMADGAFRDALVREGRMRWRLDELRANGRAGVAAIERLLGDERRPHSWLERKTLRALDAAGIAPARTQVHLKAGGKVSRVDIYFDAARLVVEVNGHRTHSTRRQRQADAERVARLRLQGYTVLEFTYEDVTERPDYVCQTVAAALATVA